MEYRCQEPLADMSYRLAKVSAQTDVTSVRPLLPPPSSFLLMKWVPDVVLSLEEHGLFL